MGCGRAIVVGMGRMSEGSGMLGGCLGVRKGMCGKVFLISLSISGDDV